MVEIYVSFQVLNMFVSCRWGFSTARAGREYLKPMETEGFKQKKLWENLLQTCHGPCFFFQMFSFYLKLFRVRLTREISINHV